MGSVTVVVIEELGDSRYILRCARCNGTGRYIHDTSYECKSCHGVGAQPVCGDMKILK